MGILNRILGQEPEHRPQGMGDGSGLGKVGVREQNTDPIRVTGHGVVDDLLEFGFCRGVPEDSGLEAFFRGSNAEVAEQGCVMHPVHARFTFCVVNGLTMGGQNDEVAFAPFNDSPAGFDSPRSLEYEEQLAGGQRGGCDAAVDR